MTSLVLYQSGAPYFRCPLLYINKQSTKYVYTRWQYLFCVSLMVCNVLNKEVPFLTQI